jgi:hypothetical protein
VYVCVSVFVCECMTSVACFWTIGIGVEGIHHKGCQDVREKRDTQ